MSMLDPRGSFLLPVLLLTCVAFGGSASAADPPFSIRDGNLADAAGLTVYTYDKDTKPDGSTCNGQCAVLWPPCLASKDARPHGRYTLVTRDDGRRQWAIDGMPLYYWLPDRQPGEASGDGVNGIWHVVRPE